MKDDKRITKRKTPLAQLYLKTKFKIILFNCISYFSKSTFVIPVLTKQ